MPGMLDTVLNLGLNDETVVGLERRPVTPGSRATARTADPDDGPGGAGDDPRRGRRCRTDPMAQLRAAVEAVFRSWDCDRARAYRATEGIDDSLGTAVSVQAMVFGNRGERSGTGVVFTRDPSTGAPWPVRRPAAARRARTSSRATRAAEIARMAEHEPDAHQELRRSAGGSSSTTATSATWSSPSRRAGCGCCRRASASAARSRRCASRPSSSTIPTSA